MLYHPGWGFSTRLRREPWMGQAMAKDPRQPSLSIRGLAESLDLVSGQGKPQGRVVPREDRQGYDTSEGRPGAIHLRPVQGGEGIEDDPLYSTEQDGPVSKSRKCGHQSGQALFSRNYLQLGDLQPGRRRERTGKRTNRGQPKDNQRTHTRSTRRSSTREREEKRAGGSRRSGRPLGVDRRMEHSWAWNREEGQWGISIPQQSGAYWLEACPERTGTARVPQGHSSYPGSDPQGPILPPTGVVHASMDICKEQKPRVEFRKAARWSTRKESRWKTRRGRKPKQHRNPPAR